MKDQQLLRYSRQILLPEIDIQGQERLLGSSALIIGVGGLGSPVAMYLAAAGVGHLHLVDGDQVDLSNLQRQIAHTNNTIGQDKVESAKQQLLALNPDSKITTTNRVLKNDELSKAIAASNIVIDCSDNFETRFELNRLTHQHKIPLVSGAAIRWEGQISVFTHEEDTPCYHCLYGSTGVNDESCSNNGVLSPVVGIIGSMQACEAIKVLSKAGQPLESRLLILDALYMEWRTMKLRKDPECPVCGISTS